eukprot:GSChrysophyteH1.ASY1.ANO1.2471.1 assembled CDS
MASPIKVDSEKLVQTLDRVNQIGLNAETGGINRIGYSDFDIEGRQWLMGEMKALGMKVWMDGVGNVFGRYGPEDGPCIMAGSHLDSVPEGGKFDGVFGVISALESVRTMRDNQINPDIAIEVVAFAEEEGRFGGMLGSQSLAGCVDPEWLEGSKDANGVKLSDAMAAQGFDYKTALTSSRVGDVKAFLEIHIEQGPVLEQKSLQIGVVKSISGTTNPLYTIIGESNHSGTTPMELRKDAASAFFLVGAAIPDIIEEHGTADARMTIGSATFYPNFPHTVPGKVSFSMNCRDNNGASMDAMDAAFTELATKICEERGLQLEVDRSLGRLSPVALDENLRELLLDEATKVVGSKNVTLMSSGAGHDSQNLQTIAPAGLLFIPSRKGISHSPEEFTDSKYLVTGTQVLCNALIRLSCK